jgi:hypothetical protein
MRASLVPFRERVDEGLLLDDGERGHLDSLASSLMVLSLCVVMNEQLYRCVCFSGLPLKSKALEAVDASWLSHVMNFYNYKQSYYIGNWSLLSYLSFCPYGACRTTGKGLALIQDPSGSSIVPPHPHRRCISNTLSQIHSNPKSTGYAGSFDSYIKAKG